MKRNSNVKKLCTGVLAFLLAFGSSIGWAQETRGGKGKSKARKSLSDEQKVIHLLSRATFGPRPDDVERVRAMGWEKFLDEQLHPERIADQIVESKLKNIESIHLSINDMVKYYPQPQVLRDALKAKGLDLPPAGGVDPNNMSVDDIKKRREYQKMLAEMGYKQPQLAVQELQQAKVLRAVYSDRQLQEVMTDFWFNHFNVYIQKGADRILTTSYERDVIRPRVFGKFEDLLKATAESPAMLFYLDNFMSAVPDAPQRAGKRARRGLNENYAREIMELHTLGVDGGYSQKDVQEVARCFTGWTLRNPRGNAEFVFNPAMHDDGEKVVLGKKIAAGGGVKDGYAVIHMLATHPATARFISTKLARKFIADNPPRSLVDRMAQTYLKTGGDIRDVLLAMFKSPEFWSAESYRAKIKTPFEMTVSAVRAIGAETDGGPQFHRWISQMGEGLYLAQPPTGYADTAEHWVNTGALLERMNFALALGANRIPGTRVNFDSGGPELKPSQVLDRYLKLLLRGEVSPQTRATMDKNLAENPLAKADGAANGTPNGTVDVAKVVGLILGSPEFQRQ